MAQVRLIGDPAHDGGAVEFFQGIFQVFDALDNELFNSGDIRLPGSDPEIAVAINATGAKRIRFTSTGVESLQPSLAEFQVISGPSEAGSGLNHQLIGDAALDFDLDGLTNLEEFALGTSIFNPDTDGDGLTDLEEGTLGSNPLLADSDNDGLTDKEEQALGTNFNLADTDGDGLNDGIEVRIFLNPLSTNSDNDNPVVLDGSEDTDGDGITNFDEIQENTDPGKADTDGDGINDLEEITAGADGFITDPRKQDTDGDRLADNFEIAFGFDPNVPEPIGPDADQDGLPDDFETANAAGGDGSNLAFLTESVINTSSALAGFPKENAVDGDLNTSWFANTGDAANQGTTPFIQVTLPFSTKVSKIKLFGNRTNPDGFDFIQGIIHGFDENDVEIFDSGLVTLPLPDRDLELAGVDGLRKVKFTSIVDESLTPGLSEFEVIADLSGKGLNPEVFADADLDFDGDGFSNLVEFHFGTSIFLVDSDADGLADNTELSLGSDPNLSDTDGDGLTDRNETDPTLDFDGDGTNNILDADADNDGLQDGVEVTLGLSHLDTDSDDNGTLDDQEDNDSDDLVNIDEVTANTDPGNADTDGDGINDGEEVVEGADGFITNPLLADTDGDGMFDGFETQFGLNPLVDDATGDLDSDGISNLDEFLAGTDPTNPDTVPPTVFEINPLDGAADVPVNGMVTARFAEPLQPESVVAGVIQLFETGDPLVEVPGTVSLSMDHLTVTFESDADLNQVTPYTVRVQGVRDVAGNLMAGVFESTFTTTGVLDNTPPSILRTSIFNFQSDVPINSPYTVEFSEPVNPSSLTPDSFQVLDQFDDPTIGIIAETPVTGMIQVDADGMRASFIPDPNYPRFHTIIVKITTAVTDLAGNPLEHEFVAYFFPDFFTDTDPLVLENTFPQDGNFDIPLNAVLIFKFDEPLDVFNDFQRDVKLEVDDGGISPEIPGSFSMSGGNGELTFVPEPLLAPNTRYRVTLNSSIKDVAGNPLTASTVLFFQTGMDVVVNRSEVTVLEPTANTTNVPTNTKVSVRFSEPIAQSTINDRTFGLIFTDAPGTVATSPDGLSATFTLTDELLPLTVYTASVSGSIKDRAGRNIRRFKRANFTTGTGPALTSPEVELASLRDEIADVPVNAILRVRFNVPVSQVDESTFFFRVLDGTTEIPGTITFGDFVTFTPTSAFAPGTTYTLEIGGFVDYAGNLQTVTFNSEFTTSASSTADTSKPGLTSISPVHRATNVPVTTNIIMRFSEKMDPLSLTSGAVRVAMGGIGRLGGDFSFVDDTTLVFTPTGPFPGNTVVLTDFTAFNANGLKDLAGNFLSTSSFFTFTTEPVPDTTVPQIISMSPADGSVDVSSNTAVVLVFSETMDPSTLVRENFGLFIDGETKSFNLTRSLDSRTVTLESFLPTSAVITVVATEQVKDFSGNSLTYFQGQFTTTDSDPNQSTFANQKPGPGATGVPVDARVSILFTEPLDPASLPEGLLIVENNILKSGTYTLDDRLDNKLVQFTPDTPFGNDNFVEIFQTDRLLSENGSQTFGSPGPFRTQEDPGLTVPRVIDFIPLTDAVEVPTNAVIEVRFNESLNMETVNTSNVILKDSLDAVVPAKVTLIQEDKVIRIEPEVILSSNTDYSYEITAGVQDPDGNSAEVFTRSFMTGDVADNIMPEVIAIGPPNGATDVAIEVPLVFGFDEPINPLSVTGQTVLVMDGTNAVVPCTIQFFSNNQNVKITTLAPLTPLSTYTVTIAGVEDRSGNPVIGFTSQFDTGTGPDTIRPVAVQITPGDGAVDVPVNSVIRTESNEPLDFTNIIAGGFSSGVIVTRPDNSSSVVPGFASLSPDGKVITFVPDNPFPAGERIRESIVNSNVTDLSGNRFIAGTLFTVGTEIDTLPPNLVAVSPNNGGSGVPRNPLIRLKFDEPIYINDINGVSLEKLDGTQVPTKFALLDGSTAVTLRPLEFLESSMEYLVKINASVVTDSAGNASPVMIETSFSTGDQLDPTGPTVVSVDPVNNVLDVPVNSVITATFDEILNPLFLPESSIQVKQDFAAGLLVKGTLSVSPDQMTVTFTPDQDLRAGLRHRLTVTTFMDLAGNQTVGSSSTRFTTAGPPADITGPRVVSVDPPFGAADVPTHTSVIVQFDEAVVPTLTANDAIKLELTQPSCPPEDPFCGTSPTPVSGTVNFAPDQMSATFTPDVALEPAIYSVTISNVKDLADNLLVNSGFSSSFSTIGFISLCTSSNPELCRSSLECQLAGGFWFGQCFFP